MHKSLVLFRHNASLTIADFRLPIPEIALCR
jgi:hypothetical protein